jgi:hypothetical protein
MENNGRHEKGDSALPEADFLSIGAACSGLASLLKNSRVSVLPFPSSQTRAPKVRGDTSPGIGLGVREATHSKGCRQDLCSSACRNAVLCPDSFRFRHRDLGILSSSPRLAGV